MTIICDHFVLFMPNPLNSVQKWCIYKPYARNYYGFNFIVWKISVKITTAGVVIYVDDAPILRLPCDKKFDQNILNISCRTEYKTVPNTNTNHRKSGEISS